MNRQFTMSLVLVLAGSIAMVSLGSTPEEGDPPPRAEDPAVTTEAIARPHYTPEEEALRAIQEEGRRLVAGLTDRMRAESDPDQRRALQQQATELKKQTRLRFLVTLADFARQRGDEVTERAALDQIDRIENPPRYDGPVVRQTPAKAEARKGAK